MSKYAEKRTTLRVNLGSSVNDNTNILSWSIPPNREVELFGFWMVPRTGSSTSGAKVEIVDSANAALSTPMSISVEGTSVVRESGLPIKLCSGSSSEQIFHVRTDGASGTCDVEVFVCFSDPGCAS